MILALLVGFVTGWAMSMPIGPVNATAISKTLHNGFKYGMIVGLGAALMDFIYCAGAAQIHQFLSQSPLINLIFQVAGFVMLVWLGISLLRTKTQSDAAASTAEAEHREEVAEHRIEQMHLKESSLLGSFMIGVVLYASNVAAVPEWIFISGFWRQSGALQDGLGYNLIFAVGAGLGTAGWFLLLVRYFTKRREGFKPKTIHLINRFSAYAMLVFGLYFGYQIAFVTNWQEVNTRVRGLVSNTRLNTQEAKLFEDYTALPIRDHAQQ